MKKYLPTPKSSSGFTLVELMVVVSIIAILSVIGVTLFTNAQKSARDAVRRQEIKAIANALETNYDNSTAKYPTLALGQFATGTIPTDIYTGQYKCGTGGTKDCDYCVRNAAGTQMTKGENGISPNTCPTGGTKAVVSKPPTDTAYEVCATLETNPYYYCDVNSR